MKHCLTESNHYKERESYLLFYIEIMLFVQHLVSFPLCFVFSLKHPLCNSCGPQV